MRWVPILLVLLMLSLIWQIAKISVQMLLWTGRLLKVWKLVQNLRLVTDGVRVNITMMVLLLLLIILLEDINMLSWQKAILKIGVLLLQWIMKYKVWEIIIIFLSCWVTKSLKIRVLQVKWLVPDIRWLKAGTWIVSLVCSICIKLVMPIILIQIKLILLLLRFLSLDVVTIRWRDVIYWLLHYVLMALLSLVPIIVGDIFLLVLLHGVFLMNHSFSHWQELLIIWNCVFLMDLRGLIILMLVYGVKLGKQELLLIMVMWSPLMNRTEWKLIQTWNGKLLLHVILVLILDCGEAVCLVLWICIGIQQVICWCVKKLILLQVIAISIEILVRLLTKVLNWLWIIIWFVLKILIWTYRRLITSIRIILMS